MPGHHRHDGAVEPGDLDRIALGIPLDQRGMIQRISGREETGWLVGEQNAGMLYPKTPEGKRTAMKAVKCTKDGVVIPSAWVKGWGKPVVAYRNAEVVILESPARAASRRLATIIRKVRRAAQELGPLSSDQVAAEVAAVRAERARRS